MVGIGFFAPLPLALMLPFMAGQSMIMGEAFGKAYQYGKRRISSMSNAEFNKLTAKKLSVELATDYTNMLPALSMAIKKSEKFQQTVIDAMLKIPVDTLNNLFGSGGNDGSSSNIGGIGSSSLTGTGGVSTGSIDSAVSHFMNGLGSFFEQISRQVTGKEPVYKTFLKAVQDVKQGKSSLVAKQSKSERNANRVKARQAKDKKESQLFAKTEKRMPASAKAHIARFEKLAHKYARERQALFQLYNNTRNMRLKQKLLAKIKLNRKLERKALSDSLAIRQRWSKR